MGSQGILLKNDQGKYSLLWRRNPRLKFPKQINIMKVLKNELEFFYVKN